MPPNISVLPFNFPTYNTSHSLIHSFPAQIEKFNANLSGNIVRADADKHSECRASMLEAIKHIFTIIYIIQQLVCNTNGFFLLSSSSSSLSSRRSEMSRLDASEKSSKQKSWAVAFWKLKIIIDVLAYTNPTIKIGHVNGEGSGLWAWAWYSVCAPMPGYFILKIGVEQNNTEG